MPTDSSNIGEKALGKVAELGIASQLDEVESIDVDIRTDPGKLVQGKLDSVAISGQGLVMKQDLRMETLEINTNKVEINPLSAVFGNIELIRPTDAEAQIILTEADINRAFSSAYIQNKLHNLKMELDACPVTVDVQQVRVNLPGDNKFVITADFFLKEQNEFKNLSATAIPQVEENGHRIALEILSAEGQGLTTKLVSTIFDQLTDLLDLRNFDIPGLSFQLSQLNAQKGRLLIYAIAQIEKIPSA